MKPVKVRTTARKRSLVDGAFAGLSGPSMTPWSPPLKRMTNESSRLAAAPTAAATSWMRDDSFTSSSEIAATAASMMKNHGYQPQCRLVCAVNATDMKNDPITSTNEIPTANAPPYSQPPRKPALGFSPREMYV